MTEEQMEASEAEGFLVEADEEASKGSRWKVRIIKAGRSKNGRLYAEAVLKKAAPLFEGARVLARSDEAHIKGADKSVTNIVGWLDEVAFSEGAIYGYLNVTAEWLRSMLAEAWARGKKDLVGLSIVAEGHGKETTNGRERLFEVAEIVKVSSVDIVFDPAAGGGLVKLVAATDPNEEERQMDDLKGLTLEQLKEKNPELLKEIEAALAKAAEAPKAEDKTDPPATPAAVGDTEEPKAEDKAEDADKDKTPAMAEAVSAYLAPTVIDTHLGRTKLPEAVKDKIAKRYGKGGFVIAELTEAIKDELDVFADLEKDGLVRSSGTTKVEVAVNEAEKAIAALDGFFRGSDVELDGEKVPRYRSFKEAYIDLTGDKGVKGQLPRRKSEAGRLGFTMENFGAAHLPSITEAEGKLLVEAGELELSTWAQVLGDSITRRAVAEYRSASDLAEWASLVDSRPVSDFRTQRITRVGGYADLATVAELGSYLDMTTPGDEEATYAITKRGGTETISLEAISNDDLNYIRRIPAKMGRAAARTQMKFVLDFLRTNPTIYDAVTLFHATHGGNLGSTALSVASFNAGRQIMRSQTEADSSEALGLVPRHLWVPNELEQLAFEITMSDRRPGTADNDANFARAQSVTYHVVDYWTDANNWFLTADKADIPLVELGSWGGDEPEIFTQDNPQVGSMFDNDTLKYKIRHVYGGAVVDFRGFFGAVVA